MTTFAPRPEAQPQRRAEETVGLADLILQVALVGEVDEVSIVHVEQEGRRIGTDL